MHHEAEQVIWKPVLGALGAASVILMLVGNLVFSPLPSSLPTLKMADSEGPLVDRSNSRRSSTVMVVPAVRSRQIDQTPSLDVPAKSPATIVDRPAVSTPVESQNLPCDTAGDVLIAEQPQPAEQQPHDTGDVVGRSVELPVSPAQTEQPVLVAEQAPVTQPASPSEQAPHAGPSIASQPAPVAAVNHPILPDENAGNISVAACGAQAQPTETLENADSRLPPVAVENSATCVIEQKLSHYERKMRRKLAHLEKKRNRLFNSDCCVVCR
jgi:hypothetical protein